MWPVSHHPLQFLEHLVHLNVDGTFTFEIRVTNTGNYAGKEEERAGEGDA